MCDAIPAIAVLQFGMIVVSAMQSESGKLPELLRRPRRDGVLTDGDRRDDSPSVRACDVLSDELLATVHCRMLVLVPSLLKTAFELRKYSLPPLTVAYVVPGTVAGQTVKPAPSGPRRAC